MLQIEAWTNTNEQNGMFLEAYFYPLLQELIMTHTGDS